MITRFTHFVFGFLDIFVPQNSAVLCMRTSNLRTSFHCWLGAAVVQPVFDQKVLAFYHPTARLERLNGLLQNCSTLERVLTTASAHSMQHRWTNKYVNQYVNAQIRTNIDLKYTHK